MGLSSPARTWEYFDPFLLGVIVDRQIDSDSAAEFYRHRILAWMLDELDAIKVRRFGVPVGAIRTAIARLQSGRIVGICPRRGRLSRGKFLHAPRAGSSAASPSSPTAPASGPPLIIGADRLNRVGPWLPFRRGPLWVAFGNQIIKPRLDLDRKSAREVMAGELQQAYLKLFAELDSPYGLGESTLGLTSIEFCHPFGLN